MTDEEIDRLTIGEVRAISARAADALAKFAEARALLGAPVVTNHFVPVGAAVILPNTRPPTTKRAELTADEIAQRDVLVAQSRGVGLTEAEEAEMLAKAGR